MILFMENIVFSKICFFILNQGIKASIWKKNLMRQKVQHVLEKYCVVLKCLVYSISLIFLH